MLLRLEIAPAARQVFADRRAVKQILVNLLSNGVKYTPPGGEVVIAARIAADRAVEICVRDTGTGIAPADLERLGKPFEQVETAAVRAKEGTGLGLALVTSLAQLHGGEARLSSVLGEGTTVTVRLPHAAVNAQGERMAPSLPFKRRKVFDRSQSPWLPSLPSCSGHNRAASKWKPWNPRLASKPESLSAP